MKDGEFRIPRLRDTLVFNSNYIPFAVSSGWQIRVLAQNKVDLTGMTVGLTPFGVKKSRILQVYTYILAKVF